MTGGGGDESNKGAVLAVGTLSEFSAVSIDARGAASTITLDAGSFGANTVPALSVQGNGMTALVVEHGAGPLDWQVNGDGTGSVKGAGASITFAGVASIGGGGADALHGPAPDTTWHVTGAGSGTLSGTAGGPVTSFTGFGALDGAASNRDNFLIESGGSIAGRIEGGTGGFDTVGYDGGTFASLVSAPTGPQSGTLIADGVITDYSGMEPVTSTAVVANMTLKLNGTGGQAVLMDAPGMSNMLELSDPGHMETVFFAAPTGTLTIDLGSAGTNTLTLSNLDSRFVSGLTVVTGGSGDIVAIDTSLATRGHAVSITADTITLATNRTIDTTLANGNTGSVSFAGKTIALNAGSSLVATAGTGKLAGAVNLTATDITYRVVPLPLEFTSKTLGITLTGATIAAGDVNIAANAADLPFSSSPDLASYASGFTSTLSGLLGQLPGVAISAATGVEMADLALAEARARSTAEIDSRRSKLDFAQADLSRGTRLLENANIATQKVDELRTNFRVAQQDLATAELNRQLAILDLGRTQALLNARIIRSPVDGIVTQRALGPGEFVAQDSAIVTLAVISPLHVQAYPPVSLFSRIKLGQTARVALAEPPDTTLDATVTVVDRVFDAASGTVGIQLTLANDDDAVPAGQRCRVAFNGSTLTSLTPSK